MFRLFSLKYLTAISPLRKIMSVDTSEIDHHHTSEIAVYQVHTKASEKKLIPLVWTRFLYYIGTYVCRTALHNIQVHICISHHQPVVDIRRHYGTSYVDTYQSASGIVHLRNLLHIDKHIQRFDPHMLHRSDKDSNHSGWSSPLKEVNNLMQQGYHMQRSTN